LRRALCALEDDDIVSKIHYVPLGMQPRRQFEVTRRDATTVDRRRTS
jgi:hypothetical protein